MSWIKATPVDVTPVGTARNVKVDVTWVTFDFPRVAKAVTKLGLKRP